MVPKLKRQKAFKRPVKMLGTKYHYYFQGFLANVGFSSGLTLCIYIKKTYYKRT